MSAVAVVRGMISGNSYTRKGTRMIGNVVNEMQQKLLSIAKEFDKWLEKSAEKYDMSKDDIQELIKQFLQ